MTAPLTVLVTGATGFLGQAVVAALLRHGHRVRAGVRDPGTAHAWPDEVLATPCDLDSGAGLDVACAGADAVIHLAAAMGGSAERQAAVAVDGTRRLLEAMRGKVPRLLLASSFAVYDWAHVGAELDESSILLEEGALDGQDAYTRAKRRQEQLARTLCAAYGIDLTVLRPALVWSAARRDLSCLGPGSARWRMIVAPRRTLRLTHVDNCADAFVTALDARAAGQTFNIDDGAVVSAWDYAAASGVSWRIPVPLGLALGFAAAAGALLRPLLQGRPLPGLLVPQRLRVRFHHARANHAALRRVLGWSPPLADPLHSSSS